MPLWNFENYNILFDDLLNNFKYYLVYVDVSYEKN